jgi:hypothetical protein
MLVIILSSCKKTSNPPSAPSGIQVETVKDYTATSSTMTVSGKILSNGSFPIGDKGIIWGPGDDATVLHTISLGPGTENFTATISSLEANSLYVVKAYAVSGNDTAYGALEYFFTKKGVPSLRTSEVDTANNHWKTTTVLKNDGGADISSYGVCWSTNPHPTVADKKEEFSFSMGGVVFTNTLSLSINSTYYIRAFAINSYGIGYSNEIIYTTHIAVGLYHGGGIIFLVTSDGQHGLIAALSNQSTDAVWGSGLSVTNATSENDGRLNTSRIVSTLGTGNYAANICKNYTGGGFTDWYLPAVDELWLMHKSGIVPDFPGYIDPAGEVYYWSSTEINNATAYTYLFFPNQDLLPQSKMKWESCKIRPIREF